MITWLKEQFWPRLRQTFKEWSEDDGGRLAASTAYYAAFSLFPLLLVLTSFFGFLLRFSPGARDAQAEILSVVARSTSPDLADQLRAMMLETKNNAGVSGPIGLVTLLIGAMGIFAQVEDAFDHIWDVPAPAATGIVGSIKRALFERFNAFLMMFALGMLVLASAIIGLVLTGIGSYAAHLPAGAIGWRIVQITVSVLLNALVFGILYKVIPNASVRWQDVWLGALLVAIIWEVGRIVLAEFIIGGKYGAYGVIGSFVAVMAWIYYASTVLFLGAEFVQVTCSAREQEAKARAEREAAEALARKAAVPVPPPTPPAPAPAGAKAAYAAGGAVAGALGVLLLAPVGVVGLAAALLKKLRRK
jgi:membrane protein